MDELYKMALDLVDSWRASDGGLTCAAVDALHLGGRLDEEYKWLVGAPSEEIVGCIEDLRDSLQSGLLTGTEVRLIEAQIKRLGALLRESQLF